VARRGRGPGEGPDYPDGAGPDGLRQRHLLLLPTTTSPQQVGELLASRVPAGDLAGEGEVRFGRHCRLYGPFEMTMEEAVDAGVPMPWTLAYALDAPIEREEPPAPGQDDRDGFAYAFPDGLPWREEGRALQLLVGLARRLHGAVRLDGGALVHPDADRAVDIVIHSPTWLDPTVVHGIVARVLPGAQLAVDGADWGGPDDDAYSGRRITGDTAADPLSSGELHAVHTAADEVDMASLAEEDTIDAYAVAGEVGPSGQDGAIDVLVHVSEPGEPAVAGEVWSAHPFVTYEVRWSCPEPEERERRVPGPAYLACRERVRPSVKAVARALVEATGGVITDEEGFRIDRYAL
jgi:hypothetical protein